MMPTQFNPRAFFAAVGATAAILLVVGLLIWVIVGMPRLFPPHDHTQDERLIDDALQQIYKNNKK